MSVGAVYTPTADGRMPKRRGPSGLAKGLILTGVLAGLIRGGKPAPVRLVLSAGLFTAGWWRAHYDMQIPQTYFDRTEW